jgi:hypothetical protein
MRTLLMAGLIASASVALGQNATQPPAGEQKTQSAADQAKQKELQERIRVEGAAGGTAPVPEEKRRAVNADAGPHKHHVAPKPKKLPRDEPVVPPE